MYKKKLIRKNIILSAFFLLIIVIGIISFILPHTFSNFVTIENVWSGEVATSFSGGNGTKSNPYQITNGEELAYFKQVIEGFNSSDYSDKYYVLTQDINMGNLSLSPIGVEGKTFTGSFDGQGYTIANLKIEETKTIGDNQYLGLFSVLNDSQIENVNFDEFSVSILEKENLYVGLIAGSITNNTIIKNVALSGNIEVLSQEDKENVQVGSISGFIEKSNLSNIFITSNITNENTNVKVSGISPVINNTNLTNILVNSNVEEELSHPGVYNKDNLPNDYLDTLNSDLSGKNYKWVSENDNYYLQRNNITNNNKKREVSHNIVVHDSGVDADTVYVNDLDADYNYYMGRNYTDNDGSNVPTMEKKNVYNDTNLVNVQINYYGTEYLKNGTALKGTISLEEQQTDLKYFKVYPVSDNGTSNTNDDYLEIELIDNPYANRPTGYAFNGWVSTSPDYQVTLDNTYFVYKTRVPVTYANGKPEDIVLDFQVSWTEANVQSVSNGWTTLENEFYAAGMQKVNLIKMVQDPLDMTGYFTQHSASRNEYYTGYTDRGVYQENQRCTSWFSGCTYYTEVTNEYYNSSNTYYELRNDRMTQVSESDLNFTYHEETEQRFVDKDMAGFYTLETIANGNSIDGYFNDSGEIQNGTCQNRNGCSVYRKVPLLDENGNTTYMSSDVDYYYLVTRDTNIALLDVTVSNIWGTTLNKPFTLTSLDSGEDYRNRAEWEIQGNNVTCHNNTRIEFVRIVSSQRPGEQDPVGTTGGWYGGASSTLFGNYFNVKLGRGITHNNNYQSFNSVIGGGTSATGSASSITKYKIIIESGFYNSISLVNGTDGPRAYVEMIGVYGNDYDRVTNNNSNLDIYYCAGGAWGGDVHASTNSAFAITSIVKSGSFGTGKIDHTSGIYVGGRSGGAHYAQRRLFYEGGWTYNLIGGPLTANSRGSINDIYIAIKGGEIDAVYGGAGTTATYGNRIIQITGGTVNYSVFGGSNGYNGSNGDGTLNGDGYIYVGGNATIGNATNVQNNSTLFGMEAGSVFGIGNGKSGSSSIGSSDNSYIIIDEGATILGNIYGGGNFGAVGVSSTSNSSETIINVLNGTINGNIYGGGNRNGSGSNNKSASVTINVQDGTIKGSIYGGSNEEGIIYGDVNINLNGGTINNDVYGGGYGGYSNSSDGTYVRDNVRIKVGNSAVPDTPKINGSVYGGSAFGTVNGTNHATDVSQSSVDIVVNNGLISKSVFGGGKGNSTYTPYVLGNIVVTVNDGNIANVFGGNDAAGMPNGDINIYLKGGTIGDTFGGGNNASVKVNHVYLEGSTVTNIFGGSNASGTVDESNIITKGGTVETVYGGNNTGGVTTVSNVTIDGGTIKKTVYGGGRLADTGTTNVILNASTISNVFGGGEMANVSENTNVTQNGSTVTNLYGGSNSGGDIPTSNIIINGSTTTNVFGGNNADGLTTTTNITVNDGNITNIYGGGNEVGVTTSNIKLGSGTIGDIYGGSNQKGDVTSTNITTFDSDKNELQVNNVYGGNNLGGETQTPTIRLRKGTYGNVFGGGNRAVVSGDALVSVTGVNITASIYGGGNNADLYGNTTVNIFGTTNIGKSIFGGGNHGAIGRIEDDDSVVTVNVAGAVVGSNVYGGCNTSVIYGETNVNIGYNAIESMDSDTGGDIEINGTVFGGGESNEAGSETYDFKFISVTEGINILIDGTGYGVNELQFNIYGSIFGSGNASSSSGPSNIYVKKLGTRDNPNSAISIQRADVVTLDGTTIELIGTTDRTNEYSDIKYSLNRIKDLKIKNSSMLLLRENANMLEKFTSLVDVNGSEEKAQVTIDKDSKKVTRNTDNRLYMLAGKKLNVTTDEGATVYGVVSGMTFFGMYEKFATGKYNYGFYDDEITFDSKVDSSSLIVGGSYVAGLHNTNHDIEVDGYYTNYIDDSYSNLTVDYINPTPPDSNYYMWMIGTPAINYDITLTASKYSSFGTYELQMVEFSKGSTIFNVIGFNGSGLEEGIKLVDSATVPKLAPSNEEANDILGLSMKSETVEWTGHGTTKFLYDGNSNSYTGDKEYATDNQTVAPSLMFYLYHAKNITSNLELGTVVITLQALTPVNAIEYETQYITITITINTKEYDDEDAYDASITYSKKYEMPSATSVNITNKSQFTTYFSLAVEAKSFEAFYGKDNNYHHTLVSNWALPVGTKITMIDYGADETNPKYYYYIVDDDDYQKKQQDLLNNLEVYYPLSKFIKMDSIDKDNTYSDSENNHLYFHDNIDFIMEEFIFIFDFQNTNITGEQLGNTISFELHDIDDWTLINVLNIRQNYMNYNLYETSNVVLEEEASLDNNYLYYDIAKDINYSTIVEYNQTELRQSIVDTNYESSSMGINVAFYDVAGNQVSSTLLSGTTIMIDGETYYVDGNGIYRIKLTDKVAKLTKNLSLIVGDPLPTGSYKMRITLFASNDGLHNSSDKEPTVKEIDVTVVGNNNSIVAEMEDESKLVIGETGLNMNDNKEEKITLKYSSVLANPNIRLSVYKRNIDDKSTNEYTEIAIDELFTNIFDYPNAPLVKQDDYEYMISTSPTSNIDLSYNLKDNLLSGTYRLTFKLYDGNQLIDEDVEYIIVRKNV